MFSDWLRWQESMWLPMLSWGYKALKDYVVLSKQLKGKGRNVPMWWLWSCVQCQPLPHRHRPGTFVVIGIVGHVTWSPRLLHLSPIIMFLVPLCAFFFFSRFRLFIAWLYDFSSQLWSACLVEKVLPQRMGRDKHRKVSNNDISVRVEAPQWPSQPEGGIWW